jgi:hypothetical protein
LIRSRGEVKLVIDLLVAAERFGGLDVVCNLEGLARYQGKVQKSDVNTAVQVRLVKLKLLLPVVSNFERWPTGICSIGKVMLSIR